MNNQSIEKFYSRIGKRIKLLAAFTGNNRIAEVIRMCRLKPISVYLPSFNYSKAVLEKVWVDEFNYRLVLHGKKIQIRNDCAILNKPITDIYRNQSFNFILNHSLIALVGIREKKRIVFLLGSDGYLRCFNESNMQISALCGGIKILKCLWTENKSSFEILGKKCDVLSFRGMEWFRVSLPLTEYVTNEQVKGILTNGN